uniref:Kelch like family member 10 n=1 Tax=Maylandia zebra TaxID=106582 RepID=A0A3P9DF19_9CICH
MSEEGQLPYKSSSVNNELCLEGQFCDAIIKVEDVEFPVHRIILCNCTPYSDKQVFNIPGLSSEMMALIINFAYTGSVSITGENVVELLMAADQFNNCVGIWQFTKVCLSPELRTKTYHYIISNFEQVVLEEEFLHLTVEELADILIERTSMWETTLYERLQSGLHYPKEVRLGLMTSDYLKDNVLSSELVEANSECLSMISNAILDIHDLGSRPFMSALYHPLARPRLPHSILLAYDCRANRWVNVTNNLECPRAYHGAAFLNGYVYSVGGFDGVEHFNSVRRFDLTLTPGMRWRPCIPPLLVSVTVLNGSAERYQPEINQSHASCTQLTTGWIYICGGLNGNECLQTAEYYNPESNQWTMISPMNSRRSGIGVIAYADHVFAVRPQSGGFDGNNYLRTAEAYNPHTNTWNLVFSMLTPRSNFGIEVIDDRLFVVGGFNGFTTTSDVEYYTALTNEWYEATLPRDFLPLEDHAFEEEEVLTDQQVCNQERNSV